MMKEDGGMERKIYAGNGPRIYAEEVGWLGGPQRGSQSSKSQASKSARGKQSKGAVVLHSLARARFAHLLACEHKLGKNGLEQLQNNSTNQSVHG